MAIVYGVELFNGPPPERSALRPLSGEIVDSRISKSKGRLYAEIQVRAEYGNVILSQRMPQNLATAAAQAAPGTVISALITGARFTDARTGLERRSFWQLSVGGVPVVPFEDLMKFHAFEAAGWKMFAHICGAVGAACVAVRGLRRRLRADP